MQWSEPAYLWALLGLLIPLAIHLLSRQAGRVVRVGSIRHLVETNTRKFSSIRFNEYLLFAFRAGAVILFVLLLVGLHRENALPTPRWVLVEDDPAAVPGLAESLDSLEAAGYELRYLAEGFPAVEAGRYPPGAANYPALLRILEKNRVEGIVYAKNRLNAFPGKQMPLPEGLQWLQIPVDHRESVLMAERLNQDTVALLQGFTAPERTTFTRTLEKIPQGLAYLDGPEKGEAAVPVVTLPPLKMLIMAAKENEKQAGIVRAAVAAIADFSGRKMIVENATGNIDSTSGYDWIVNLTPDLTIDDRGAKVIRWQKEESGRLLVQTGKSSWAISRNLNRQSVLRENLLYALAKILLTNELLDTQIRNWDLRTLEADNFFNGVSSLKTASVRQGQPLDKWLVLLLITTVLVERILAYYRKA